MTTYTLVTISFIAAILIGITASPPQDVMHSTVEIDWKAKSDFDMERLLRGFVYAKSEEFGVSYELARAIISCEGGWDNPSVCNGTYGCIAGQGHFQFIPSTWTNVINADFVPIPDYCRTRDGVFISECNLTAGVWLLAVDGDRHWRAWSGGCYLPESDLPIV